MTDRNIEMSTVDRKDVRHDTHVQSGVSSNEQATVFNGEIDPIYEAKATVLNKAVC